MQAEKLMSKTKSKPTRVSQRPEVAIQLHGVTKEYELHHEKPTFVEQLVTRKRREIFTALKDLTLTIYQGEKIGIVGHNGSGKTTLLKIIAGITTPTAGSVTTNGRVVSLIDLEAGFHPDLTGEENIFLNGMIIGMTKSEVQQQFQNIVNFADIKQFIDAPLHSYSEGMKLRLGFSIAAHSQPDILLLDEMITVGDEEFQEKSGKKIEELFRQNKTIIVVTHWTEFLKKHCQFLYHFSEGKIVKKTKI